MDLSAAPAPVRLAAFADLDAAPYAAHPLHQEGRIWVEKNCYIDIWIEVLHSLGLTVEACLGFVLAIDFEGDQWTFFKPSHDELNTLYGLDVQELNVWRPLIEHVIEHVGAGKLISTEADSFWLPDTAGTDYRSAHGKTTIVINSLDLDARRLGYFHNAGYHRLEGRDFVETFRLDAPPDPEFMPLFAEFIRFDRCVARPRDQLLSLARPLLRKYLGRRPVANPIVRFGERFQKDFPGLQDAGLAHYHQWAFATLRQLGAAFELAAVHVDWIASEDEAARTVSAAFLAISQQCKTLILKCARAVNGRKPLDLATPMNEMAVAWQDGMDSLERWIRD